MKNNSNTVDINAYILCFRAIWWNVLGIGSLLLLCAYAGLVVFAYYDIHECDPISMKV